MRREREDVMFRFDFWDFIGSCSLLFAVIQLLNLNNSPIQPKWRHGRPKQSNEEEKKRITYILFAVFLGYLAMGR